MIIYYDSLIEYEWFINLNHLFKTYDKKLIATENKNPTIINDILKYDKADIYVSDSKKNYLAIEKTSEVPTGHNVGQRMARLVRAVELGVPYIYFVPFKARKHGEYTSICYMNARLYKSIYNMWKIHNSPIFLVNWQCDEYGELINDGKEDLEIANIISMLVKTSYLGQKKFINNHMKNLLNLYKKGCDQKRSYEKPPPSVTIIDSKQFVKNFNNQIGNADKKNLINKNDTVVYTIKMNIESAKRQDPYTGMQFIYDYLYCRDGKKVENKSKNLILFFPKLTKAWWLANNPNNNTKSSNWYLTANGLLFTDGYIFLR